MPTQEFVSRGDFDTEIVRIDNKFDDMTEIMLREFDKVYDKFDAVDRRFDAIDRRFDALELKFNRLDHNLQILNGNLGVMGKFLVSIGEKLGVKDELIFKEA